MKRMMMAVMTVAMMAACKGDSAKVVEMCRADAQHCEAPGCAAGVRAMEEMAHRLMAEGWQLEGEVAGNGVNCRYILWRR